MSQRRIRPSVLYENNYGTRYPSPTQRTLDASTLNGGLNLWEESYRLNANQSPDLENMYWNDGCLSSRPGQSYIFEQAVSPATQYGDFKACYERLWPDEDGYIVACKGTSIYKIDKSTGAHTAIYTGLTSTVGGTFFVFGKVAKLYYLSGKEYIEITQNFTASAVVGYIPTTVMNRTPDGLGGNEYQPENRIAAGKKVLFTSDGTSTVYSLPYSGLDATTVTARVLTLSGGVYIWVTKTEGTDFTVDRTEGTVTFTTAPAQQDPATDNNVEITCYKTDADTMNSILTCTKAITYGSGNDVCVVVGGCTAQPNAYFWSGNNAVEVTATYFPFDQYNYAGNNALDPVTGFGKQQNMLVIFQEHTIGKSSLESATISERLYLNLPYTPINSLIGCDLSGSIRSVNNNLLFANTYNGVYALLDTTAAGENSIKRISRNINGQEGRIQGLLNDLKSNTDPVSSYTDGNRYWICVGTHVYLWDYSLLSVAGKEENLSWFFFSGVDAKGWIDKEGEDDYFFMKNGSLVHFNQTFDDFGGAYLRRYVFSTLNFGTYEAYKDILKVIFEVKSQTDTIMNIWYTDDYQTRADATPIVARSWHLVPRDLSRRYLGAVAYALSAVRMPRSRHIRHFSMTLINNTAKTDMSLIGAQIIYRYVREDR